MIVKSTDILNRAKEEKRAIPQFNINNLEWARFILEECEEIDYPVILGVSEGAIKYMGGYNVVSAMIYNLVRDLNITVPVILHLDHGTYDGCLKAMNAGFTSIMYDGSKLPLSENITNTKRLTKIARDFGISVEAEIGHIGGEEDGIADELAYANVSDAIKLAKETGIQSLAPALGSVHGIYKGEPKLDFDRMKKIAGKTKLPLVLHGGTGIPDELIKRAISLGVAKININTELQIEWSKAVREYLNNNSSVYDPRKIIKSGEVAIKKAVRDKIALVSNEPSMVKEPI